MKWIHLQIFSQSGRKMKMTCHFKKIKTTQAKAGQRVLLSQKKIAQSPPLLSFSYFVFHFYIILTSSYSCGVVAMHCRLLCWIFAVDRHHLPNLENTQKNTHAGDERKNLMLKPLPNGK